MRTPSVLRLLLLVPSAALFVACTASSDRPSDGASSEITAESAVDTRDSVAPPVDSTLFTLLPASYTGVTFANDVRDTKDVNVFTYRNHYNGGGVAIGDLNGDSLPELLLTSNDAGPTLYLNEGAFRFRDITKSAKLVTNGTWTTGVTMADVNADGRLDVYVSHAGKDPSKRRANQLFINQGNDANGRPTFKDLADEYGVADGGYTTHAVFFDHDRDGDLDLFLINNSPKPVTSFGMRNTRAVRDSLGGAKLYRNDNGRFTDVSAAAGIFGSEIGFGLGVAVADVNRDGLPDIYVANDFFERDYLYMNKGDGTFAESLDKQMPYSSYFSMGLDIADIDNDGWPDIYTTDMFPEDEYRLRTTSSFEGWDIYKAKLANGYHHQFMRNMLQRNNSNGTFSDVGQVAGVSRTDWSWSALIADFDLDGRKDVFVTNGLAKDVTSQDYISSLANQTAAQAVMQGHEVDFLKLVDAMSSTRIPNYMFRNDSRSGVGVQFTNTAAAWGLATPSFSNGAAYGDLDGDGALDLVVNNVNMPAFVYRNNVRALHTDRRSLQVVLDGDETNRLGFGARVTVRVGDEQFVQEQSPVRGFQSSMHPVLTFGVGTHAQVDSLMVEWPDGRVSVVRAVATNQRIVVRCAEAVTPPVRSAARTSAMLMDVTAQMGPMPAHRENDFVDFDRERLMPKMVSMEGPAVAVADVNGDGLDDVYLGGAKDQAGQLLLQQPNGRFAAASAPVFAADAVSEDVSAVFFDANADGRPDLYVVSGGNEFSDLAPALQDRLYLNDGNGRFHKAEGAIPLESSSGSRVAAADFDGDGDIDLFVGGRVVPGRYGRDPESMLLRNDGTGRFTNVTSKVAPKLANVGMVTDAVWQDITGDRRPELIVVGEWMPITVFRNSGGRLEPIKVPGLEQSGGWWNRIVATDVTGDGKVDFVVGNLGTNGRLRASAAEPAMMHIKDFDGNGFDEQIVSTVSQGKRYPIVLRDDLIKAVPPLKARFRDYKDYATQTLRDVFADSTMATAIVRSAQTFETMIVRNNGNGSFTMLPLPQEAQLAPVYGVLAHDLDGDGVQDLLLAGNFDGFKPELARMASSYGVLLRRDSTGGFAPVSATRSGFVVPGQTRDIKRVRTRTGDVFLVVRNNDTPLFFKAMTSPSTSSASLRTAR